MWIIYELLIRWRVRSANKNFPDAHDAASAQSRAKRAAIREIPLLRSGSPQDGNTVNLR